MFEMQSRLVFLPHTVPFGKAMLTRWKGRVMKTKSLTFLVPLLVLLSTTGCAAPPPDAPRILYFEYSRVSVAAVHGGRITVERSFEHPGIINIVGADVVGQVAALYSVDPMHGGITGDMRVQFLNLRTGQRERVLTDPEDRIQGMALSPDGGRIALELAHGRYRQIEIEDLSTGRRMPAVSRASRDSTIGWSPDGQRIVFTTTSGALAIYEVASGKTHEVARGKYPAWSPDGTRIAFATESEVRIVDLSDRREKTLYRRSETDNYPAAVFLSWSLDGRFVSFNSTGHLPGYNACKVIDLQDESVTTISYETEFCGPWLPAHP